MDSVKTLLSVKRNWTQHTLARDFDDNPVNVSDYSASKFCLLGAIYRVYGETGSECTKAIDKVVTVLNKRGVYSVVDFNDDCATHKELMEVLQEAGI